MDQILQNNNDSLGAIESELGDMQSQIDIAHSQLDILNVQVNALTLEKEALEKQRDRNAVYTEITIPVLCACALVPTVMISDDTQQKGCFIGVGCAFVSTELIYNVGHFLFKWW